MQPDYEVIMERIKQLGKSSIDELSEEEAMELLKNIRAERRSISTEPKKPKKAPTGTRRKQGGELSKNEARALLALLEGGE